MQFINIRKKKKILSSLKDHHQLRTYPELSLVDQLAFSLDPFHKATY